MIPMRSEQEEGTGVILATGRPRLVMRMPSAGRPSSRWRHCSRKSLTFNVFISSSVQVIAHLSKIAQCRLSRLTIFKQRIRTMVVQARPERSVHSQKHEANNKQGAELRRDFGRGERIRTSGLLVPNQALYQAEPRPDMKTSLV